MPLLDPTPPDRQTTDADGRVVLVLHDGRLKLPVTKTCDLCGGELPDYSTTKLYFWQWSRNLDGSDMASVQRVLGVHKFLEHSGVCILDEQVVCCPTCWKETISQLRKALGQ
jgi:hypothetical protein